MSRLTDTVKRLGQTPVFTTSVYASSRIACSVLGMVSGLLTVRLIDPASLGYFNTISLGQGYLIWLQLGIFNGLNRELPYFYSKGDTARAHALVATAQSWALLLGGIFFAGFAAAGGVAFVLGNTRLGAALMANAVISFVSFYATAYLSVTFRTKHDFVKLALIDFTSTVVGVVMIGAIALWHYYGICLRAVAIVLASLFLMYRYRPVRVKQAWSREHFKHLFQIGIPIYLVGQVFAWWSGSLTPTLVAWKCGAEGMGLYAFVTFTYTAAGILGVSVSQVYYPRMVEDYAKFGSTARLFQILRKPTLLLLLVSALLLTAGWLVIPYAIRFMAPKYVAATLATQCALAVLVVSVFLPVCAIFNVIKKQALYLTCMLVGMVVHVGCCFLLMRHGIELHRFVIAENIGKFVFIVAAIIALLDLARKATTVNGVAAKPH